MVFKQIYSLCKKIHICDFQIKHICLYVNLKLIAYLKKGLIGMDIYLSLCDHVLQNYYASEKRYNLCGLYVKKSIFLKTMHFLI